MHAKVFNGREQCAIDSNQKSVKYSFFQSFCRSLYLSLSIHSHLFVVGCWLCSLSFSALFIKEKKEHKEIKIDDDCSMMMVHCIKIQKFLGFYSQNGFFEALLEHTLTHVWPGSKWLLYMLRVEWEWECVVHVCMPEERYIKCAAYVNHIRLALQSSWLPGYVSILPLHDNSPFVRSPIYWNINVESVKAKWIF